MKEIRAYRGDGPFIFVSYSHKDSERVSSFICELQKKYNVWFDEGIHYGREWEEEIAEKLKKCSLFIYMVTEASLNSANCKDEIYSARENGKNFLTILVDSGIELPSWFSLRYGRYQMCRLFTFRDDASAIEDIEAKTPWFGEVRKDGKTENAANDLSRWLDPRKNVFDDDWASAPAEDTPPPSAEEEDEEELPEEEEEELPEDEDEEDEEEEEPSEQETPKKKISPGKYAAVLIGGLVYVAASALCMRYLCRITDSWILRALLNAIPMLAYCLFWVPVSAYSKDDMQFLGFFVSAFFGIVSIIADMFFVGSQKFYMNILIGLGYKVLPAILWFGGFYIYLILWQNAEEKEKKRAAGEGGISEEA